MQPRELARMVLFEGLLVAIVGSLIGVLTALPMYGALLLVGPVLIGFKEPFVVDPASAVIYTIVAIAVSLLGSAWPAWRTSRVEVLEALAYE
jgi:putative ABC transport system permease protein